MFGRKSLILFGFSNGLLDHKNVSCFEYKASVSLRFFISSSKNNDEEKVQSKISNNKATRVEQLRQSNYISHKEVNTEIEIDDVDKMIDEYVRTVSENKFTCALNF